MSSSSLYKRLIVVMAAVAFVACGQNKNKAAAPAATTPPATTAANQQATTPSGDATTDVRLTSDSSVADGVTAFDSVTDAAAKKANQALASSIGFMISELPTDLSAPPASSSDASVALRLWRLNSSGKFDGKRIDFVGALKDRTALLTNTTDTTLTAEVTCMDTDVTQCHVLDVVLKQSSAQAIAVIHKNSITAETATNPMLAMNAASDTALKNLALKDLSDRLTPFINSTALQANSLSNLSVQTTEVVHGLSHVRFDLNFKDSESLTLVGNAAFNSTKTINEADLVSLKTPNVFGLADQAAVISLADAVKNHTKIEPAIKTASLSEDPKSGVFHLVLNLQSAKDTSAQALAMTVSLPNIQIGAAKPAPAATTAAAPAPAAPDAAAPAAAMPATK